MARPLEVITLPSYERVSIPAHLLDPITTRTVIIKPNISTRTPASYTHPAVVRALAQALRRRGHRVLIGEGMHLTRFKQAVLHSTGYDALLADFPLVDLEKERCVHLPAPHPALPQIALPAVLMRPDVTLVNVPKLKMHLMTHYTGPIKNIAMGIVNQHTRAAMHRLAGRDFSLLGELMVAAYLAVADRVSLTVVDAGAYMEGDGPTWGRERWLGQLICGPTLDAEWRCARLMGADRAPVPQALGKMGLAPGFRNGPRPLGARPPATYGGNLAARLMRWKNPDFWASVLLQPVFIGRSWSRVRIDAQRCTGCGTCREHCPNGAIEIDFSIDPQRCSRCLCCVENCPEQAAAVQHTRLMRVLNRIGGYVY